MSFAYHIISYNSSTIIVFNVIAVVDWRFDIIYPCIYSNMCVAVKIYMVDAVGNSSLMADLYNNQAIGNSSIIIITICIIIIVIIIIMIMVVVITYHHDHGRRHYLSSLRFITLLINICNDVC